MSFSQEMKDFLGAYQAGTKINSENTAQEYQTAQSDALKKKTARDNDPDQLALEDEQARAKLAATKAGTALIGERIKTAGVSRGYTQAMTDRLKNAGDDGSGLLPPTMGGSGGNGGAAVGTGTGAPATAAPQLQSTMAPSTTDNYAAGGAIPDDADGDEGGADTDDDGDGAQPRATDFSASRRRSPSRMQDVIDPNSAHDAVKAGYAYGVRAFGLQNGVRTPRQRLAAQQLSQGAGALTPKEMDAARRAVDPDAKMTDSQRNMAALGAVYQYWANKGEPEKAQKVAFQMLQNYRVAAQRYGAIAAHAAQQGNIDLATKAALKAYANVPDGREAQITVNPDGRILYHFTDENGQTVTKGLATPQELASSAMGLATHGFDQAIMSAAGQREADAAEANTGTGTPKGNGTPKGAVQDMSNRGSLLDAAMEDQMALAQKKGMAVDPQQAQGIKNNAMHVMQQNPDMTPSEAIEAAMHLTMTRGGNPAADWTTTQPQEGKNALKMPNGRTVNLDDNAFNSMMYERAAGIKAQQAKEKQTQSDQAASDARWKSAGEGVRQVGRGMAGALAPAGEAEMSQAQDMGATGDALTTAIGHGVQAALQALRGSQQGQGPQQAPGAIPAAPDDSTQMITGNGQM